MIEYILSEENCVVVKRAKALELATTMVRLMREGKSYMEKRNIIHS